ncbi:cyclin-domain-containing protein [Mollisia scopiformis]|uniref:Cyclin-domain-containing protein n=1 Tax=Mollisia scopiformis TaxID=149040 RepID=A0A194XR47_MOLSC|nr:cyclin-domain-containing protein [Mollisia scopiformis]KUJ22626.1 cyclin-domain-containing protein [Mollisia scopiformis]
MIGGSGPQLSPPESQYRQQSRPRNEPPPSPRTQPTSIPAGTPPRSTVTRATEQPPAEIVGERTGGQRFASQSDYVQPAQHESPSTSRSQAPLNSSAPQAPISRSARSLDNITQYGGNTIKVRDLAHIQSFATEEFLSYRGQSGRRRTADDPTLKYEISGMPITDIIEMVAGLLTKITTTNDRQHEPLHRPLPSGENAVNMTGLSSSVLAFHGKNVPSITILSYLSRIHKYCPTTYEVFLSLLVYFDRMTERVNASPIQALNRDNTEQDNSRPSSGYSAEGSDLADSPPSSRSVPEIQADLERAQYTHAPPSDHSPTAFPLSHFFVVDSFNIHRLVIAGVTCASKFFSDVFYTNSRYAKVGGLPLAELNHLELQFLLLNDFRLSVPVEELEAYGTMLVEFYAREVIAQRQGRIPLDMAYPDDMDVAPQSP